MATKTSGRILQPSSGSQTATVKGKRRAGVIALDLYDGVLRIAIANSLDNISYSERSTELSFAELELNGHRLSSYKVLATEESQGQIAAVEQLGLRVETLPRLAAIYWSFREKAGDEPCLALSVTRNMARGALLVDGSLDYQQADDLNLSLSGIWNKFVDSNRLLKKLIDSYAKTENTFHEKVFESFVSALNTGAETSVGPIVFAPPFDFSASFDDIVRLLQSIDRDHLAKTIILVDWAAKNSNLPQLLEKTYSTVLSCDTRDVFLQAVRGMVAYSLNGHPRSEPVLFFTPKHILFQRVPIGESSQTTLTIKNAGLGILRSQVMSDQPWLKVIPASVTCKKGEERIVSIYFNSAGLLPSRSYSGQIQIASSIGGRLVSRTIQVSAKTIQPITATKSKAMPLEPINVQPANESDFKQDAGILELPPIQDHSDAEKALDQSIPLILMPSTEVSSTPESSVGEPLGKPATGSPSPTSVHMADALVVSQGEKSVGQASASQIFQGTEAVSSVPRRSRRILVTTMSLLILGVGLTVAAWYWTSSHPTTESTAAPTAQATDSQTQNNTNSADEQLKQLRIRRIRAQASNSKEIVGEFVNAEQTYSGDYRFPYERAKLSIKGTITDQEAFNALFIAAKRAIEDSKDQKMNNDLLADKDGDFYNLSQNSGQWQILLRALANKDKTILPLH